MRRDGLTTAMIVAGTDRPEVVDALRRRLDRRECRRVRSRLGAVPGDEGVLYVLAARGFVSDVGCGGSVGGYHQLCAFASATDAIFSNDFDDGVAWTKGKRLLMVRVRVEAVEFDEAELATIAEGQRVVDGTSASLDRMAYAKRRADDVQDGGGR